MGEFNIERLKFFLDIVQVVEFYNLSISSGKRSIRYNELVDGHPLSRHLDWDAWDLVTHDERDAKNAFEDLKRMNYYGYVREAGERKMVKIWQIHCQRIAPRK